MAGGGRRFRLDRGGRYRCAVLLFDLGKWRWIRFICGLNEFGSVLFLCQLFCWGFQLQIQGRSFGFYFAGGKYQQGQA